MAQEQPPTLPAQDIAELAVRDITQLTGKKPLGATSVMPTDDGWTVEVEVVEDRRIPSSTDLLALYEVVLDMDGELLSYRRTRRYGRCACDSTGGQSWPCPVATPGVSRRAPPAAWAAGTSRRISGNSSSGYSTRAW
jgi:hypothetical protein